MLSATECRLAFIGGLFPPYRHQFQSLPVLGLRQHCREASIVSGEFSIFGNSVQLCIPHETDADTLPVRMLPGFDEGSVNLYSPLAVLHE
jgi:hypothetical protein